jgi:Thiamine pyrophosphate enzyme, N-terminal TPP binding domain
MPRTCPQVQPWLYGYDAEKEVAEAYLKSTQKLAQKAVVKVNGIAHHGPVLNGINGSNGIKTVNGVNGINGTHNAVVSYTAAEALVEALVDADVTHLFVNLGSDHPALLEALSRRIQEGRETLKIITAANEFVGLCACQGFFQASGKMQAILVHVDCGTLAMAGAIHNVARARIPVLMIAGTSPVTEENEMMGSRNVCDSQHHISTLTVIRSSFIIFKTRLINEALSEAIPSSTKKFELVKTSSRT